MNNGRRGLKVLLILLDSRLRGNDDVGVVALDARGGGSDGVDVCE